MDKSYPHSPDKITHRRPRRSHPDIKIRLNAGLNNGTSWAVQEGSYLSLFMFFMLSWSTSCCSSSKSTSGLYRSSIQSLFRSSTLFTSPSPTRVLLYFKVYPTSHEFVSVRIILLWQDPSFYTTKSCLHRNR